MSAGARRGLGNPGVGVGRMGCTGAEADSVTVWRTLDHITSPARTLLPAAGKDGPTIHPRPEVFSLRVWYSSEDPPLIHHRTATLILAVSGLMLSACASGSPAPPKSGRQVVRDRLAAADDAPYSAALRTVTQSGPRRLQLIRLEDHNTGPESGDPNEAAQEVPPISGLGAGGILTRSCRCKGSKPGTRALKVGASSGARPGRPTTADSTTATNATPQLPRRPRTRLHPSPLQTTSPAAHNTGHRPGRRGCIKDP